MSAPETQDKHDVIERGEVLSFQCVRLVSELQYLHGVIQMMADEIGFPEFRPLANRIFQAEQDLLQATAVLDETLTQAYQTTTP